MDSATPLPCLTTDLQAPLVLQKGVLQDRVLQNSLAAMAGVSDSVEKPISKTVVLTLYTRHNCSLCEDMLFLLHDFADDLDFSIDCIDIDSDTRLVNQFNDLVPVLKLGVQEICHHFFDRQALLQALDAERNPT